MSVAEALFAMVIAARPVSSQSDNASRQKYQERLREEAHSWFRVRPRLGGPLYLRIVWFQRFPTKQDTDNIVKPVSDALIGIIYDDDNRIAKYLVERISSTASLALRDSNTPKPVYDKLTALILRETPDIPYIEVGDASPPDFYFGPFAG